MSSTYVTLAQAGANGSTGGLPIFSTRGQQSEKITSGAASVASTIIAKERDVAQVWCATTVAAVAGPTPVATLATGIICPAGVATTFAVQPGDKIAVIDA